MKLAREHMLAIISFIATIILTLIASVTNLDNDTTYTIFAVGATVSLTASLLEKQLEDKVKNEIGQSLEFYRLTEAIDDADLRHEVMELARSLSRGEIPPHIASSRSGKLFAKTRKTIHAADYNPTGKHISRWEGPRLETWYQKGVEAVKRGVNLERIFILNKEEVVKGKKWDEATLRVLKRQSHDGIMVRILWIEDISKEDVPPQRNVLQSLVIFDEKETLETTNNVQRIYRHPSEKMRECLEIYQEQRKFSRSLEEAITDTNVERVE